MWNCRLYMPGHCVHHIQARLGWEDEENPPVPATLVGAGDSWVEVRIEGRLMRYRNHEVARLVRIAEGRLFEVAVQERWSLLKILSSSGSYLFSIGKEYGRWADCPRR